MKLGFLLFILTSLSARLVAAPTEEHRRLCLERGSTRPHGGIECVCPNGLRVLTVREEYCPGVKTFDVADILEMYYYGYEYRAAEASGPGPNYGTFKKLVEELDKKAPLRDLDSFLKHFSTDPRLKAFYKQHTRMHHSLSTQRGKRLLTHGRHLLLGIPLEAHSSRKETVEIFEVDEAARSEEMLKVHVLDFSSGHPVFVDNPLDKEVRKQHGRIPNCAACHGSSPNLRWATYNFRPGAWRGLASRGPEPPRMRFFEGIGTDAEGTGPFVRDNHFGIFVAEVSHKRMVKKLVEQKSFFERYQFALMGALLTCDELLEEKGGVAEFLPEAERLAIEERLGKNIEALKADTKGVIEADYRRRHEEEAIIARAWQAEWLRSHPEETEAPVYPYYTGSPDVEEAVANAHTTDLTETNLRTVTWLRYLAEGNGIDTSRWSTASTPRRASYAFNGPGAYNLNFMVYPLLEEVVKQGATDLLQYSFHNDWVFSAYHTHICEVLKQKSLHAFGVR